MSTRLGIARRIRYLARRARAIDFGNVGRIARAAATLGRRPWFLVALDMAWCSVRYELAFQDYLDWDFVILKRAERKTFMTHPKANRLAMRINDRVKARIFSDKSQFNVVFANYIGRKWLDIRKAPVGEVAEFLAARSDVMVKVPDSLSGLGIEHVETSSVEDVEAFIAKLQTNRQFLVEEFISQHPIMASLNPSSVNSLRVISYQKQDKLVILASVLKAGNGGAIDNFSNGGMYTMLDTDGVARHAAFDGAGQVFERHPLTGVQFEGFQVPNYDAVKKLVFDASKLVPEVPYVGWDIAIGPEAPLIIEGNPNSGVFQSKPSVSGQRTGLLPLYRSTFGF